MTRSDPAWALLFVVEAGCVLRAISVHDEYATAPYDHVTSGVVRRVFFERFPYRAFFLETAEKRVVLRVLHNRRNEAHWRSRI